MSGIHAKVTIEFTGIGLRECDPSTETLDNMVYTNDIKLATKWCEIAGWMDDAKQAGLDVSTYEYDEPKKVSWLQKVRGYDDLQFRCQSAEAMRDHYKTISELWQSTTIAKSRDLELMTKVADNWQKKLICVNKDYIDATKMIGRRLKFSVGHNHIEIIVGNPVTACYFTEVDDGSKEWVDRFLDVSICHKNDQFDWKRGAIESLENMIKNYLESAYGDRVEYFNALFTAYPELGIQPVEPKKPVKKSKKK